MSERNKKRQPHRTSYRESQHGQRDKDCLQQGFLENGHSADDNSSIQGDCKKVSMKYKTVIFEK